MPKTAAATTNRLKLEIDIATAAIKVEIAAEIEASANPTFRPIARIRRVAGTVVAATLMTMIDTGNVASACCSVSCEPMIPPNVTRTIEPVAEIS